MTPQALWDDARLATALFAVDSAGLGGVVIRGRAGPVRERLLAMMPGPARRLPASITDEALFGGLDLAATLRAGRPVRAAGMIADVGRGTLVAPMAERLPLALAARLAGSMDSGASFGLVLLDESAEPDEQVPAALLDRVAFHIDIDGLSHRDAPAGAMDVPAGGCAGVTVADDLVDALCGAAASLGVGSVRAVLLAVRAARAAAAFAGRTAAGPEDAAVAARLVLSPRATLMPAGAPEPAEAAQDQPAEPPPDAPEPGRDDEADQVESLSDMSELVLAAARAAIPAGLLARLGAAAARGSPGRAGVAGQRQKGGMTGRPVGVRAGQPGAGVRLNLVETLRAAAPWQRLRAPDQAGAFPLHIRRDDFRIVRTEQRARSTTVFLVDASGSAALNRLAEAKGAVELLLAECYRRRDEVAVIAFRGRGAQVLLPPTRSLVRAKRSLATLPGGGGTPLAAGIDAGCALAMSARRAGATPTIVLLTDGRANVTRAGGAGRAQAGQEALQAGRQVRQAGFDAVLLDTSPRAAPEAGALARAMGARYVPLPYADSASVSRAVMLARA